MFMATKTFFEQTNHIKSSTLIIEPKCTPCRNVQQFWPVPERFPWRNECLNRRIYGFSFWYISTEVNTQILIRTIQQNCIGTEWTPSTFVYTCTEEGNGLHIVSIRNTRKSSPPLGPYENCSLRWLQVYRHTTTHAYNNSAKKMIV